jgi:hypothetical protein
MARDIVNAEIARQREAELRRHAERYSTTRIARRTKAPATPQEAVTIRIAAADDRRELDIGDARDRPLSLGSIATLVRGLIARRGHRRRGAESTSPACPPRRIADQRSDGALRSAQPQEMRSGLRTPSDSP